VKPLNSDPRLERILARTAAIDAAREDYLQGRTRPSKAQTTPTTPMTDTATPPITTGKPTITQLQANQLVFAAGVKAEQEARAAGMASEDAAALLDAASGGVIIGGIQFPPIHGGFMLMMGRVEEFAKQRGMLGTEMGNMGALAFILKNPKLAWDMLRNAEAALLFEETVTEFVMCFTMAELIEVGDWIKREMERLNTKGGEAGKPSAA